MIYLFSASLVFAALALITGSLAPIYFLITGFVISGVVLGPIVYFIRRKHKKQAEKQAAPDSATETAAAAINGD